MCCAASAHTWTSRWPSSDRRRRRPDDGLPGPPGSDRRPHQGRGLPAAGTQTAPDAVGAATHWQRGQPADPHRRWAVGQPAGARPHQRRRDDDGRPAGAGHDFDGHCHHDGHRGVRAGADLPVIPTDHCRGGQQRPPGPPGPAAPRRGGPRGRRGPPPGGPLVSRHRTTRRAGRAARPSRIAMSLAAVLTPLPVLIPPIGAALSLFAGRKPRLQRAITLAALSMVVVVCAALLYLTDRDGTLALHVGGWGQTVAGMGPLGSTLVVDRLSALMMVVSSIVLLAVVFYAIGQGIRDGDERQPVSIFLPTYLALSAGVCNAFLAGDLFNLFVGFEVLLSASFVLLTIGASAERVRVGISYVMVSMVASLIFLLGIALIYAATGTLNMAELALRLDTVSAGTRSALFAVLLVAFGIKAAVFPLSAWLPDSYPTAPAPVTAVFAGLLTKVGVYAIIRAHSLLLPGGGLDPLLLVAALLTMLVGILGAIAQSDIKRLLSFTLVSHIGYMVFGIALSSRLGMSGAIYYVAHHIVVQTTLFLVVGLIERQAGASTMQRLGGLAAASPLLAFLFVVPALNLGGIPPFSGFIGKVALLQAGAQNGSVLAWTFVW